MRRNLSGNALRGYNQTGVPPCSATVSATAIGNEPGKPTPIPDTAVSFAAQLKDLP